MKLFTLFFSRPSTVKLEIETRFLVSLLEKGQIHAADFRCLDFDSKQLVWKALLSLTKSKFGGSGNLLEEQ